MIAYEVDLIPKYGRFSDSIEFDHPQILNGRTDNKKENYYKNY